MKFLCPSCKSKYQIADEKVAGRTLRMTCQQCGEAIVVRGPGRTSGAMNRAVSQPMPMGPATSAGVIPAVSSSLGADFQRQMSNPSQDMVPARGLDEWHVAINDVPVGPMRREEVARKINAGAVDGESLAWREGMDDWLPLRHIPELAALYEPRRVAPPVAPPPPAAMPLPPPPAPIPMQEVATRSPMAPIGGRQMMTLDDYAPAQTEAQMPMSAAVSTMTLSPVAAEPAAAVKPLGWGPMFLLVAGGAFILAVGALLGVRVLAPQPAAPVAPVAAAPVAAAEPSRAPSTAEPQDNSGNVIELDMQAIDGQGTTGGNGTARKPSASAADKAAAAAAAKGGKQLSDEQKAMLARMGGGLNQGGPANLQGGQRETTQGPSGGGELTASQLTGVVNNQRKMLQRCYETALRGANSDETVRMDVEIQVSPSGNVQSAHTSGKGLPGMDECLTRTVRMWRFPSSSSGGQAKFPVVFQPGA